MNGRMDEAERLNELKRCAKSDWLSMFVVVIKCNPKLILAVRIDDCISMNDEREEKLGA